MCKLPAVLACCCLGWLVTPAWSQTDNAKSFAGFRIIFDQRLGNCAACHSIPDAQGKKYGTQSSFAPALDGVGLRYDHATLMQWVTDARVIHPQTLMPPFGVDLGHGQLLTAAQITEVVATLENMR